MTKLIMFNMLSLDGYFAGPHGELDWHHVGEEFNEFAMAQLERAGGLVFGRVTYQGMAAWWPTPEAVKADPLVAGKMNNLDKYVFSRSLETVDWNNTTLFKGRAEEGMVRLKEQAGGDLLLFGSANLASTLTANGLIDEYRLMINPVVLGSGQALFPPGETRREMALIAVQPFRSGNVLLSYRPA